MNYAHEGNDTASPPAKVAAPPVNYAGQNRAKQVRIKPVRLPSGRTVFRVTGTLQSRGRQQKRIFSTLEEARACVETWERVRAGDQSTLRARFTRLNESEIADAEVAVFLLRDSGLSLAEAARRCLTRPSTQTTAGAVPSKPLNQAVAEFLTYHADKKTSAAQTENYRIMLDALASTAGEKTPVAKITTAQIERILKSRHGRDGGPISKKTWNVYRGDLAAFFSWCAARPRTWLKKEEDPVEPIKRYTKREMPRPLPVRLEVDVCRDLMHWLEVNAPEWCCYFALALFAGVRPDMVDGELAKLAELVRKEGPGGYFINDVLHLPATVTKDRRHRQTNLPPNLQAWLAKYPPTPEALNPKSHFRCGKIRHQFQIGHDALRHTAISAFVSAGKGIEAAALEFGNSERIIRSNYLNRFTADQAATFYAVYPTTDAPRINDGTKRSSRRKNRRRKVHAAL